MVHGVCLTGIQYNMNDICLFFLNLTPYMYRHLRGPQILPYLSMSDKESFGGILCVHVGFTCNVDNNVD